MNQADEEIARVDDRMKVVQIGVMQAHLADDNDQEYPKHAVEVGEQRPCVVLQAQICAHRDGQTQERRFARKQHDRTPRARDHDRRDARLFENSRNRFRPAGASCGARSV